LAVTRRFALNWGQLNAQCAVIRFWLVKKRVIAAKKRAQYEAIADKIEADPSCSTSRWQILSAG
jgi:6-phosphogluconate dehydrogenase (decarboxylating)